MYQYNFGENILFVLLINVANCDIVTIVIINKWYYTLGNTF